MNFSAGAVDNHAGVVAIATHGVAHVDVGPLSEIQMIVVRVFRDRPAVKEFVHHEKAHPIAQIQKLRSRWIVSSTNRIYTKLLERLQAAFPRAQRHGGAKRARVVMQTDALYFEVAPIEPETCVSIEMKIPDAEGYRVVIDCCLSVAEPSHDTIKVWMIQVPTLRIPKRDVLRENYGRTCVDILRLGFGGLYQPPAWLEHLDLHQ